MATVLESLENNVFIKIIISFILICFFHGCGSILIITITIGDHKDYR